MAADDLNVVVADGTTRTLRSLDLDGKQGQVIAVLTTPPTVTGEETLSVGTGADETLTPPAGSTHALATVDPGGGGIRYWESGTSPSDTVGLYVPPGGAAELTNLADVKMRATVGTVAVNVSYRHYGG